MHLGYHDDSLYLPRGKYIISLSHYTHLVFERTTPVKEISKMSVPLSSTKLRLPSGFNALIHGFCYEILKSQPEDIHAFGALYFANLLDAREGKKRRFFFVQYLLLHITSSSIRFLCHNLI